MTGRPQGPSPDRRALLRREFKERTKQAGVFRVLNTANGRVLLGSGIDLRGPLNRVACGRDSFVIEVVELVEQRDEPGFDVRRELEMLEQKHLAHLDWNTAYNEDERIRYP